MGSLHSHSEVDTIRIARDLGSRLRRGSVVLLFGQLGVGKTAFVRGLVEGAGGIPDEVTSPTFALIQEYEGRLPVTHVDLYRVHTREVDELGLEELAGGPGIIAIEWADRLPHLLAGAVSVYIEDRGADEREIRVESPEPLVFP